MPSEKHAVQFQPEFADYEAAARVWIATQTPWQQGLPLRRLGMVGASGAAILAVLDLVFRQDPWFWVLGMAGAAALGFAGLALAPPTPRYLAWGARQWARKAAGDERATVAGEVQIDTGGLTYQNGVDQTFCSRAFYPWSVVLRAERSPEVMVFFPNRSVLQVPVRAFDGAAAADRFWNDAERWRGAPHPGTTVLPPIQSTVAAVSFVLSPSELLAVGQWRAARAAPPEPPVSNRPVGIVAATLLIATFPAAMFMAPIRFTLQDWFWGLVGVLLGTFLLWRVLQPASAIVAQSAQRMVKRWTRLTPGPLAPCTVQVSEEGVHHATASCHLLTGWLRVAGVHRADGLIILDNAIPPLAVPTRAFSQPDEAAAFAQAAATWHAAAADPASPENAPPAR